MQQLLERAVTEARHRADFSGVWHHSTRNAYCIFDVGQDQERMSAFMSWANEKGITFKPLIRKGSGRMEHAFVANMDNHAALLPWLGNQESVLVIDRYDARDVPKASLHYRDGRKEDIGRMVPVSGHTATLCHSWFYDPVMRTYFIIR